MGLRVWGFRFQVSGFGFRVYPLHIQRAGQSRRRPPTPFLGGLETRVWGFGCGDSAFRFSDSPSPYPACRTDGLECGDSGFRFRVSDSPSPYPLCRTDAPKPPTPPMLLSCPNVRSLRDPPLLRVQALFSHVCFFSSHLTRFGLFYLSHTFGSVLLISHALICLLLSHV